MKLVTFVQNDDMQHIGVLANKDQSIVILQNGAKAVRGEPSPNFTDMLAFLRGGPVARDQAQEIVEQVTSQQPPNTVVSLDRVTLRAPVPRPESIRDTMAFEQHIINSTRVVGLRKLAPVDEWLERIFGKPGIDIPKERAKDHIGGYTVFNDFSARDIQMREMSGRLGPAKGKDFDTSNAIGPCLVTPDEIPDPYNLTMAARVNSEYWSRGTSADMYWTFEEIIAYISQSETLYPGEFIGSGTCPGAQGRGCGLEMGKFLKAGDMVELEVERIGILRNKVVQG